MKRFLVGAGFALALALLSGFTLLELSVQTARIRWDTTKTTTTTVTTSLGPKFSGSSNVGGNVSYGPAAWRVGGISCTKTGFCLTADGGITHLTLNVVHEDAGVDCVCDSTDMCGGTSATGSCNCSGGVTELAGNLWTLALDANSTVTATNPDGGTGTTIATIFCSADLFR